MMVKLIGGPFDGREIEVTQPGIYLRVQQFVNGELIQAGYDWVIPPEWGSGKGSFEDIKEAKFCAMF